MISALLLALAPQAAPAAAPPRRGNVLILIADDLGVDRVRAYGHRGADGAPLAPLTPNIDSIAANGVLFRNAWAQPACSQARATALTGRYPNRTGVGRFIPSAFQRVHGLRTDVLCLPDLLPTGYRSAVLGKWHLAGQGREPSVSNGLDHAVRCGFELHEGSAGNLGQGAPSYFDWTLTRAYADPERQDRLERLRDQYATTRTTDDALRAIAAFGEDPWLVWVAYNAPHSPLHSPPLELIQSRDLDLATKLGQGKAMIEALDTEIGRLLRGLGPEVLADTTVVFFGDNGTQRELVEPPFDPERAKATVYQGGVNVPFLVAGPAVAEGARGAECTALVDLADLLPSVAELVGADAPAGGDGASWVPYLSEPGLPSRRSWIYAERFRPNFVPEPGETLGGQRLLLHHQTARGERLKLVRRRDRVGGDRVEETLELFDVVDDFFERSDLLGPDGLPPEALQPEYRRLLAVLDAMAS